MSPGFDCQSDGAIGESKGKAKLLWEVVGLFLKLGVIGFSGPLAHIALMERECVQKRRWVSPEEFLDLLAFTSLISGPNSTELAIHLGVMRAGRVGGIVSGVLFILPAFLMVTTLAHLYVRFGNLPSAITFLDGMKPVLLAIITTVVVTLAKAALADWEARGYALLALLWALVTTTAFIGYLKGGVTGATVATIAIFLPAFILVLTLSPLWQRARNCQSLRDALKGINASVVVLLTWTLTQLILSVLRAPFAIILFAVALTLHWRRVDATWLMLAKGEVMATLQPLVKVPVMQILEKDTNMKIKEILRDLQKITKIEIIAHKSFIGIPLASPTKGAHAVTIGIIDIKNNQKILQSLLKEIEIMLKQPKPFTALVATPFWLRLYSRDNKWIYHCKFSPKDSYFEIYTKEPWPQKLEGKVVKIIRKKNSIIYIYDWPPEEAVKINISCDMTHRFKDIIISVIKNSKRK